MPIPQRVRGTDVSVLITRDGALEDSLSDVIDFDSTIMTELISKGYLGEVSERKDMIFKGMSFKITLHLHTKDYVAFINAIIAKAKRQTPDVIFSITGIFAFPNGDTPELTLDDIAFKPIPLSTKSRGDYTELTLEGECEGDDIQDAA